MITPALSKAFEAVDRNAEASEGSERQRATEAWWSYARTVTCTCARLEPFMTSATGGSQSLSLNKPKALEPMAMHDE